MIHRCAVGGCSNQSDTIIHYALPEEPNRRQKWVQFLGRERSADISHSTRICGSHFSEDNFTKLDLGFTTRLILNVNAVPNISTGGQKAVMENKDADETPASESSSESVNGIMVSNTVSMACVKKEPEYDELSLDSRTTIKEEPMEDDGYGDSSSNHLTEDEMPTHDGPILKIEAGGEPVDVDGGRPFQCAQCGVGFQNKAMFQRHQLKHRSSNRNTPTMPATTKSYDCKHCGKVFSHKGFLKAHEKIHASVASVMAYSCKECNRRFRNPSSLKKHMRNHLTHLKYPCPVCGEEFEMKGSLHVHIQKHPGERFPCKYCNKRFLRMDVYLRHLDKHTVVTPYYCENCKVYLLSERGFGLHQKTCPMKGLEPKMIVEVEEEEEDDDEEEEVASS